MDIEQIPTGGDANFGYVVADAGEAMLVDPSYAPERLLELVVARGWRLRRSVCTHSHHDHVNGNPVVERATGQPVLLHGDRDPCSGTRLAHGAELPLGQTAVRIIHTPGHTHDAICLHIDDALLTGDTLFVGRVGKTDFGAGAATLYRSLHERVLALSDDTRVFPGHDYGDRPVSTIGHERATNPFLQQPDIEAFIAFKRAWAARQR